MDKLRLEVLLQAVDKVTGPLKSVLAGSAATSRKLKELRDNFKQLEQQQGLINQFRNAHKSSNSLNAQLQAQQLKVKELAASHAQAGTVTAAMARQFSVATAKAAELKAKLQQQQIAIQRTRDKMAQAGVSTTGLANQERNLRAQIDAANAAISRQRERLKALATAQASAREMAAKGAGMGAAGMAGMYAGKKVAQLGLKPLDSFIQHEDAMLGVARQVQGARDAAGNLTDIYRNAESEIRALSERIPQTTVQIAAMYTAGARMEVPTENLASFVQLSSEMATAFDAVPDQLAESMGKVAKNFNIPIQNVRGLADAINYLDDNAISNGKDIIGVLGRTGGVASVVKISGQNLAAFASTLLTLGEREETAGTAINAIFTKLAAATKGTKKFQAAVKQVGLSSEKIQAGMATDAAKTMLMVTEAIAKLPKKDQLGVMVELVGMEHSDTLAKLVSKPEELQRQMGLANGSEAQGSMAREAAVRNAALSAKLIMQQSRMFNIMAEAGETLKQPLLEIFDVVNPILAKITEWVKANPELVGGILKLVVALGALMAAAGAVLIPLGLMLAKAALFRFVLAKVGVVISAAAPAMGLLYRAGFAVGAAFRIAAAGGGFLKLAMGALMGSLGAVWKLLTWFIRRNPWGAILSGIAVAVYEIYQKWDKLKELFDAGEWLKLGMAIWEGIEAGLNAATLGMYGFVKGAVAKMYQAVKSALPGDDGEEVSRVTQVIARTKGAAGGAAAAMALAAGATGPQAVAAQPAPMEHQSLLTMMPLAAAAPVVNNNNNIVIHAAPGMDEKGVARAVSFEMDRRERANATRGRSSYGDRE